MKAICVRLIYLAALAITGTVALSSRTWPIGWYPWDKSLGDALYAVAVYLILRLLLPGFRVSVTASSALAFCLGIEAFKFTGLPAAWAASRISRLVFGTTPSWHNILCYGLAIATVGALEAWLRLDHGAADSVRGKPQRPSGAAGPSHPQ